MDRSLIGHSLFAGVAAILAWIAWAAPTSDSAKASVVVIDGEPEDLSAIEWTDDRHRVVISRGDTDPEDVQVSLTRLSRPKPEKPEEKTKPEAVTEEAAQEAEATEASETPAEEQPKEPAEPEPEPEWTKVYPGSKRAQELFGKMAPLEAARSLGRPEASRLSTMGFDKPQGTLVVRFGNEAKEVTIGRATYGSGDAYARVPDGEVFLLRSATLSGLRHGASSMLERKAVGVEPEEIHRVEISSGVRGREVMQRYAEEPDKAFFADPAVPDKKLEQVSNWLDRVLKLRVADVVQEKPQGTPEVEIEFFGAKGSLGSVKIWKPSEKTALAVSTRFQSPVSITKANAEAILRDLEAVLEEER